MRQSSVTTTAWLWTLAAAAGYNRPIVAAGPFAQATDEIAAPSPEHKL